MIKRAAAAATRSWHSFSERRWGKTTENVILSVAVLCLALAATYVGYKSSLVEIHNSDELVPGYLFQNFNTFHTARFFAPHTFLIKWPLFFILGAFHNTPAANTVLIILLTIVTLVGLLPILYKISGDKLATATFALLLALITLLTAPIAHGHKFLPVNFSMITTRNIEYLLFIWYAYLLSTAKRVGPRFWLATLLLTLLAASDKFFVLVALLASVLWVALVYLRQKSTLAADRNAKLFLISSLLAYVGSIVLLLLINLLHITHIYSVTSSSPFNLVSSSAQLWTGVLQCIDSTLANFGSALFGRSLGVRLVVPLLNALVGVVALILLRNNILGYKSGSTRDAKPWRIVSYFLALATVAAYALFMFSNHDYTIDSRYVSIVLFAGFVGFAMHRREAVNASRNMYLLVGCLAFVCLPLAFVSGRQSLNGEVAWDQITLDPEYAQVTARLRATGTTTLVGNYWDVLPLRNYYYAHYHKDLMAVPLASCNQFMSIQTTAQWTSNTNANTPSALLLSQAGSNAQPTFDGCTHAQLQSLYGDIYQTMQLTHTTTSTQGGILLLFKHDIRTRLPQP